MNPAAPTGRSRSGSGGISLNRPAQQGPDEAAERHPKGAG